MATAYGVLNDSGKYALRWTYYIDKQGVVKYVDREVKPANAGKVIVQKLKELGLAK